MTDHPNSSAGSEHPQISFLREAANYFRNRPTHGEDRAFWSNVANADNCEKAANLIERMLDAAQAMPDLSDWSSLPRDLYVTSVKSDGVVFDVQCCSVPMAIGPEVRYSQAHNGLSADSAESLRRQLEDTQAELEAWFGFAERAETEAAPALINGLKGYLRTCQSGGMPKEQADLAMAVLQDYCRLYAGEALAPVLRAIAKNVEIQEAPSLNREGREHPSYDNPLDPFASPDRLPEQSAASKHEALAVRVSHMSKWFTDQSYEATTLREVVAALTSTEPQTSVVTDAMVNAAAREMWNDRDARMGGSWSGRDPKETVVIQTKATARAALTAALALSRPQQGGDNG